MRQRFFQLILILSLVAFVVFPAPSRAQTAKDDKGTRDNPHEVPVCDSPIKIDGKIEESAWEDALLIDIAYEVRPGENIPAPVRTDCLITHDDKNLYVAFKSFDPDPSAIRAHYSDRDNMFSDDWVIILLDTFNDERRCLEFFSNPLGIQADGIEADSGTDTSWDAIWDCAGRITDWGYAVEMEIPFSALRFQRTDGEQVWGIDAIRSYPRSVRHHLGAFPRDRNNNCYLCQAIKIKGFEGVSPGRNIEIAPTFTAISSDERPSLPGGGMQNVRKDADLGLTTRWGMTPNLTLGFTANPDFSQVEADALQLDINEPFALYYSEKRPFFTEGIDFFETPMNLTAIYTRTMHDPSWGVKLSGKEGANTIGAYIVRDEVTNLIFPGNQGSESTSLAMETTASVFRYKRDIGNNYTFGLLGTDREGDEYHNRVFGFDGNIRITDKDRIYFQALGSSTSYPAQVAAEFGQPEESLSGGVLDLTYSRNTRNWDILAGFTDIGDDFRADLGYIPQVGYRSYYVTNYYSWIAKPGDWFSNLRVMGKVDNMEDRDGNLLYRAMVADFTYEGPMQSYIQARYKRFREGYLGREYDQNYYHLDSDMYITSNFYGAIRFVFGDRIDYANSRLGKRFQVRPNINANISRNLKVSLDHTYERLTVDEGKLYTANISQGKIIYQLNARTFVRAIFQYRNYDYAADLYTYEIDPKYRRLSSQLLFSYKINPQTVLFLGYSDNYLGSHVFSLTQSERTFFAKVGYAWSL